MTHGHGGERRVDLQWVARHFDDVMKLNRRRQLRREFLRRLRERNATSNTETKSTQNTTQVVPRGVRT
jgi:hypothetical protein